MNEHYFIAGSLLCELTRNIESYHQKGSFITGSIDLQLVVNELMLHMLFDDGLFPYVANIIKLFEWPHIHKLLEELYYYQ